MLRMYQIETLSPFLSNGMAVASYLPTTPIEEELWRGSIGLIGERESLKRKLPFSRRRLNLTKRKERNFLNKALDGKISKGGITKTGHCVHLNPKYRLLKKTAYLKSN